MLLRSTIEKLLPVDQERGEKRLSPEAQSIVFKGSYLFTSGIAQVGYEPAKYFTGCLIRGEYKFEAQSYTPPRTPVFRRRGTIDDPSMQLRARGRSWNNVNAVPFTAIHELQEADVLERASYTEHIAKRVKAVIALSGILMASGIGYAERSAQAQGQPVDNINVPTQIVSPAPPRNTADVVATPY